MSPVSGPFLFTYSVHFLVLNRYVHYTKWDDLDEDDDDVDDQHC